MTDEAAQVPIGSRNRVRRERERGRYDRAFIHQVLDASVLGHLGYLDGTQPVVTPTVHWREGEHVYWHGSNAARYMKASANADVCLTVTHLDGLVLARSAFHHSANYRSVMLFGRAEVVTDKAHKENALQAMIEKIYPGRWQSLRAMTTGEFEGTQVARIAISDASAKVRSGPPVDDEPDYDLPLWAGVVPTELTFGTPEPDPRLAAGIAVPAHAAELARNLAPDQGQNPD